MRSSVTASSIYYGNFTAVTVLEATIVPNIEYDLFYKQFLKQTIGAVFLNNCYKILSVDLRLRMKYFWVKLHVYLLQIMRFITINSQILYFET